MYQKESPLRVFPEPLAFSQELGQKVEDFHLCAMFCSYIQAEAVAAHAQCRFLNVMTQAVMHSCYVRLHIRSASS